MPARIRSSGRGRRQRRLVDAEVQRDVARGKRRHAGGHPRRGVAFGIADVLFTTSTQGDLIAIDAASGAVRWSKPHGPGTCKINNAGGPCYTTSTPAIDPNGTYVYSYGLDGFVHKHRITDGVEITTGGWPELAALKPFDEKGSSALALATVGSHVYLYVVHGGYPGDNGDYQGHLTTSTWRPEPRRSSTRHAATSTLIGPNPPTLPRRRRSPTARCRATPSGRAPGSFTTSRSAASSFDGQWHVHGQHRWTQLERIHPRDQPRRHEQRARSQRFVYAAELPVAR